MTTANYILDTPLPEVLDYKVLREEGLAYIQEYSGTAWTNLNTSDPGVTILEQLCYAYTELGYCGMFPIKDLLTNKQGNLLIKEQFYLPETILTTAPVTPTDYIKYVIDAIDAVQNVVINPIKSNSTLVNGIYEIYLQLKAEVTSPEQILEVCQDAYFVLNGSRNLGEYFLLPQPLQKVPYQVTGQLEVETGYDFNKVLAQIQQAVNAYVFPLVEQTGYDTLKDKGETSDTIFNGPQLYNGWIPDTSIKPKKDHIQAFELTKVIEAVAGVKSISQLSFRNANSENKDKASCKKWEIIVFNVLDSLSSDTQFQIQQQGKKHNASIRPQFASAMATQPELKTQINTVASIQLTPDLPEGKYRDVANYYSIQNTFPQSYAVGNNAITSNASEFQIAQSRQLKAYLTLFDQVLTNQFAQLANIGRLFSFKNQISGDPSDKEKYKGQQYPAPFKHFAPSYFYQSLYDAVPDLKPLLRNNEIFGYSIALENSRQLEAKSWEELKKDPYNTYMWGLTLSIEDEGVNLKRRNEILDHLLARHGESPLIINTIVSEAVYTGNLLKDQVIIKSLLLQNLGLLSYNRARAYNFLGATKLSRKLKKLTPKMQQSFLNSNHKDFIFRAHHVDKLQSISAQDCIDYSGVELKLSLLFSLVEYYQNYLIDHASSVALWMIEQRKGLLFLETNLIIASAKFQIYIKSDTKDNVIWRAKDELSYEQVIQLEKGVSQNPPQLDNEVKGTITYSGQGLPAIEFIKEQSIPIQTNDFEKLEETPYTYAIIASWEGKHHISLKDPIFENHVICIFPDFLLDYTSDHLKWRLDYFLESELPVQVSSYCLFVEEKKLKRFIHKYVVWYNHLIYGQPPTDGTHRNKDVISYAENTGALINELNKMLKEEDD